MDLENIAFSRIPEPLSRGENVKKLLGLHIMAYTNQVENSELLDALKNLEYASGDFLDWLGILKGISRPKVTIQDASLDAFFNVFTPDPLGFSEYDLSNPLYFGQADFFEFSDVEYRLILKAYSNAYGFTGTIDEYSTFFKDVFGVDVFILRIGYDMDFIVDNAVDLKIDVNLWTKLVPVLSQTKNNFYQSPHSLFSLEFNNIDGSELAFDDIAGATFYFSL